MTTAIWIERALGHVRMSMQLQTESDIGLDDQETGLRDHYRGHGVDLTAIYRDSWRSSTSDNRSRLQALMDYASRPGGGVTEIGVSSFSGLARDHDDLEEYRRALTGASIRLIAIPEIRS